MPHGSRLPVGEVFAGRYELLDLIGEGGMGSVWRVHDRRENRVVAAKVLRQSDAVSLLRFVREQAVRVRHPHVVTPLGWAGEDDRVLFTMPVVEGGSVATLVGDHGPLPPLVVAELVRQLLGALGAVHEAGLVHRMVICRPGNVPSRGHRCGTAALLPDRLRHRRGPQRTTTDPDRVLVRDSRVRRAGEPARR